MTKWASSAAHHLGLDVVSSETWTWIHAPSFRATPLDLKGEAHEHALAGINQFIGHGWPCRSEATPGIGWMFYASGAFDDRNAWWPAMPGLMRYLQRLSWLLRQGEPVRNVLLYLPTTDAYASFLPSIDLYTVSTRLIPAEIPAGLRRAGHDFDLVDDHFLAELPAEATPLVLLPSGVTLPAATRDRLAAIEAAGGRVISADVSAGDGWLAELSASCPPDLTLSPPADDVGAVHRRLAHADVWFVANAGPYERELTVEVAGGRSSIERWDLADGTCGPVEVGASGILLALAPYEGAVLVAHDEPIEVEPSPVGPAASEVPLEGWWLQSAEGEDLGPVELPHRWEDDPRIGPAFSGTMRYTSRVSAAGAAPARWLDFGPGTPEEAEVALGAMEVGVYRARIAPPIREVAEVLVDGAPVGVVWDAPWRIDLGAAVRPGSVLELRVSNTTANALAADTTIAGWAAEAERLHGRRFRMQALDRTLDGVSSGLTCVPVLRS
jgi:hypothetical protein